MSGPTQQQTMAGVYLAAPPGTLANNQAAPPLLDVFGRFRVVVDAGIVLLVGNDTPADGRANPTANVPVTSFPELWNGLTWDRASGGVVDASHAAPALGAANTRAHEYGRTTTGTWEAALSGAVDPALVARAFGAGSRYHAGAVFGTTGAGFFPVVADVAGAALVTVPYWVRTDGVRAIPVVNIAARPYAVTSVPSANDNTGGPLLSSTFNDPDVAVKASGGWLMGGIYENRGAALAYFQIFNKASIPVLADVPVLSFGLAVGERFALTKDMLGGTGLVFATGIAFGVSSTQTTFTSVGGATVCNAATFYV